MVGARGRRHLLLLLALVGLWLAFAMPLTSNGSTVVPRLRVSLTPERIPARPLRGAQLVGSMYSFVEGPSSITRVRFFVDDPRMEKRPSRVVARPPFDLAGHTGSGNARPYDTTKLAHGAHTVTAELLLENGKTRVLRASFAVPHLFVAAGASAFNSCTQAAPCGTLDRAYALARPGQVIDVVPGSSLGGQTITGTKPAPRVIVRLAGSSIEDLRVEADNLEIQGGKVGYWEARAESDGLTMRGVDSGLFGIYGSANTSIIGGDVGPSYAPGGVTSPVFISVGVNGDPRNVVIDGVLFHDFRAGQPYQHVECMQIVAVNGLTIRNSRFQRCDIYSLFFTEWAGPNPPHDIVLENNWFDTSTADGQYCGCTSYAVVFAGHMDYYKNIVIRYNSFKQAFVFDGNGPRTNVHVVGNLGIGAGCDPRTIYAYNVWQWDSRSAACNPTDRVVLGGQYQIDKLGYLNADAFDLRLTGTSPAIDRGDPKTYPRRDIFGTTRPVGRRPDAGAVEAK
jgi:hypothetical protein